eukprot:scaffold57442_cov70-Phaeocystis_antarctica.AAC.4
MADHVLLASPKVGARDSRDILPPMEDKLCSREERAQGRYAVLNELGQCIRPAHKRRVDFLEPKDPGGPRWIVQLQHQPPHVAHELLARARLAAPALVGLEEPAHVYPCVVNGCCLCAPVLEQTRLAVSPAQHTPRHHCPPRPSNASASANGARLPTSARACAGASVIYT